MSVIGECFLSEVGDTSIFWATTPFAYSSSLNWLPTWKKSARLSGLERSDFVQWGDMRNVVELSS